MGLEILARILLGISSLFDGNVSPDVNYRKYIYNGCTWLLGGEAVSPSGHSILGFSWTDNPVLSIAPA